ncbi:glycosyltransferase [Promicromonospora sp. NPDC023987]|uniref:glycosyltransferase n=1 Tax=Promicromonospora sp. NPDC023987 TaxID=3155360 RepID=UPI0033CDE547
MRALIITHGTRGDVQPFVALGDALRRAGHDVLLAAPEEMAALVTRYDVPFAPLNDGTKALMDDPEISAAIETNYRGLRGKVAGVRAMRLSKPLMEKVYVDASAAADTATADTGVDVVIHHSGLPMHYLAEKLGVPAVPVCFQPGWVPTSTFPAPQLSAGFPQRFNRLSYALTTPALRMLARMGDRWRSETLGLPRRRHQHDITRRPDGEHTLVLQAFSPHVLPSPLEFPRWVRTTGFWFVPEAPSWTPPEEISTFLDAGERPVYIGFGSMSGTEPARVGRTVAEAVRRSGVRAVLVTGWGGIDAAELGDDVLVLDEAPHDWLFPRMAAIVHHGGAGTTSGALASGQPQVICPFLGDQLFWARRMEQVGVAPAGQPQSRLTPDGLAQALGRAVSDETMAARAAELGATVRAEDGLGAAVDALERHLHAVSSPS